MDFVKVPKKRLLLTQEDFTTLVSGNILVKDGVEIALHDIGYHLMQQIINRLDNGGGLDSEVIRQRIIRRQQRDKNRGDDGFDGFF